MSITYRNPPKNWLELSPSEAVFFYNPNGKYGPFSLLSQHSINYKFKVWPTVMHYYQANKYIGSPYEEKIRKLASGRDAQDYGENLGLPLRTDWDEATKEYVMMEGLVAKFVQHQELSKLILSTGYRKIVYTDKHDRYWGCGEDGSGSNHLGILLMKLRDTMRNTK